ncbi:MAG TPA: COX15/CtaA family protein [Terriglobia bacterium]|nr:COX15/CtaA family protein [Terriglobia bacterium]
MLPFSVMNARDDKRGMKRFARFAWLVLAYNLAVILWGAIVRATGSGAGCGEHWPLCEGQVIPHAHAIATLIEFAHRASSGVDIVLVAVLVFMVFRRFGRGHAVRRYAAAVAFFTVTEGLVGAALVLTGDVGKNVSWGRVGILSLHLVNTFLLLATLALTAWAATEQEPSQAAGKSARAGKPSIRLSVLFGAGIAGMLAIAISGTIAALADTLFPAPSLVEGMRWDFASTTSPIVHLRIIHPIIAVTLGGFLMGLAVYALSTPVSAAAKRWAGWLLGLVVLQFCFGVVNILLLSPLWMQVLHLLTADLVWITLVLLSAEALGWRRAGLEAGRQFATRMGNA